MKPTGLADFIPYHHLTRLKGKCACVTRRLPSASEFLLVSSWHVAANEDSQVQHPNSLSNKNRIGNLIADPILISIFQIACRFLYNYLNFAETRQECCRGSQ